MSRGRGIALFLGSLVLIGAAAGAASGATTTSPQVLALTLNGVVDPFEAAYLKGGIADAKANGDAAVLITIDTPGGLSSSTREIDQAILSSTVPVICYTAPDGARAASAGTFVMYACPVNAMAPGTNIGAAHPVGVSGAIEQEKVTNDAVATIRALAERWGRNADWGERAVRDSVSITAEEAVRINVTDMIASTRDALLEAVDGRTVVLTGGRTVTIQTAGATVQEQGMGLAASFFHGLIDPNLAFLFFFVGLALIVIELLHPGLSVPGVLGTLLLVTSVISFGFLPVEIGGVVLLVASVVFFLLELKHPGIGVPAIGGTICLIVGGFLLFNPAVPNAQVSPVLIVTIGVLMFAFFAFFVTAAITARKKPVVAGKESLMGSEGIALSDLTPEGTVRVNRETWTGQSVGPAIAAGSPVRVTAVHGVHLVVEPIEVVEPAAAPSPGPELAGRGAGPEGGNR